MSESDRSKWERRYAEGSHDETAPIDLLEEALKWAVGGRAIDVACGRGRHAVALARRGYRVDAVDISPAALASGRARAPDLPIEWRAADLDDAAIEEGAYAVVVCADFTEERLVPRLLGALAPRGILVFAARPRERCRYGPRPGEVARWFRSLETLLHREDEEHVEFVGRRR